MSAQPDEERRIVRGREAIMDFFGNPNDPMSWSSVLTLKDHGCPVRKLPGIQWYIVVDEVLDFLRNPYDPKWSEHDRNVESAIEGRP